MKAEQAMFIKFRLQIRVLLLIIALGLFDTVSIPSHLSALQPSNTQAHLPVGQVYSSPAYEKQTSGLNSYISLLMKEIGEAVVYPQSARQKRLQGRIELRLQVLNNGRLNQITITKSSGYRVLDEAARDALKKASPYSPFPPQMKLESLWVKVPIVYIDNPEQKNPESLPAPPTGQIPVHAEGGPDSQLQTMSNKELVEKDSLESEIQNSHQKLAMQNLNEKINGIEKAFEIALINSRTAQIAKEETKLAALKMREARRGLYPNASLKASQTAGDVYETQFTEQSYALQIEQPLYYGGQLRNALAQAEVNLEISREEYNRTVQDLRLEVEMAYYNLALPGRNVQLQEELLKKAKESKDLASKRYEFGLSTKAELLDVQSQYNQIAYQLTSAEKDLSLAALGFLQVLNMEEEEIKGFEFT